MTGVVLMYHRVADAPDDAYGLAVHPDRFTAQLERLRRLGGVVPLAEIRRPTRALQVAITFDDGYADNVTEAAPRLAAAGLPATFFITSGLLGRKHFWWDRLAAGLLSEDGPAGLDVSAAGRDLWLALDTPAARSLSLQFLHRRLRPLPPDELLAAVETVLHDLGASAPDEDARTMTVEQLHALARMAGVEIGAHTRSHLQLEDQDRRLQEEEISGSVSDLADELGQPVTSFAYPFGSDGAVGMHAPRLAREAGCQLACTTEAGPVVRRSDPLLLPRLNVQDWDADRFASEIASMAARA